MTYNLDCSFDVNASAKASTLWLCAPPSAPSIGGSTKRIDPPSEKRCRILVVDDEDGFRRSLLFKLNRLYDANVEEAASGSIALEMLKNSPERCRFDLILMDISMPGPSGIEVYRELRRQGVDTLVVFMSAHATDENRKEAADLSATLLDKPIDNGLLKDIILMCGGTQKS